MGPCRLTFRIVAAGVAPEPEPEPEPGADDELVGLVARFTVATERIAAAMERMVGHLGA